MFLELLGLGSAAAVYRAWKKRERKREQETLLDFVLRMSQMTDEEVRWILDVMAREGMISKAEYLEILNEVELAEKRKQANSDFDDHLWDMSGIEYYVFLEGGEDQKLVDWHQRFVAPEESSRPLGVADVLEKWAGFVDFHVQEQELLRATLPDCIATNDYSRFWKVISRVAVRHSHRDAPRLSAREAQSWAARNLGSSDVRSLVLNEWYIDLSEIENQVAAKRLEDLSSRLVGAILNGDEPDFLHGVAEHVGQGADALLAEDGSVDETAVVNWALREFGTADALEVARQCGLDMERVRMKADSERQRRLEWQESQRQYFARGPRKIGDEGYSSDKYADGEAPRQPEPDWSAVSESLRDSREHDYHVADLEKRLLEAEVNFRNAAEEALPHEVEWPLRPRNLHLLDQEKLRSLANTDIAVISEYDRRKGYSMCRANAIVSRIDFGESKGDLTTGLHDGPSGAPEEVVPRYVLPPWLQSFDAYVRQCDLETLESGKDARADEVETALRHLRLFEPFDLRES